MHDGSQVQSVARLLACARVRAVSADLFGFSSSMGKWLLLHIRVFKTYTLHSCSTCSLCDKKVGEVARYQIERASQRELLCKSLLPKNVEQRVLIH